MEEEKPKQGGFFPFAFLTTLLSMVCRILTRLLLRIVAVGPIPRHIAIIMDGNRRYADRSRIDRTRGHLFGYDRLIDTLWSCLELGVKCVTVYAFSIDNFRRPEDEVRALMNLLEEKLDQLWDNSRLTNEYGVKDWGRRGNFKPFRRRNGETKQPLNKSDSEVSYVGSISEDSAHENLGCDSEGERFVVTGHIAELNVWSPASGKGAGYELRNGQMKHEFIQSSDLDASITNLENKEVPSYSSNRITVKEVENNLYTAGCPPVDLLIRTSGETRLSNFLLWQGSSSHLYFCKVLWPEFRLRHLVCSILDYQRSYANHEEHRKLEEAILSQYQMG